MQPRRGTARRMPATAPLIREFFWMCSYLQGLRTIWISLGAIQHWMISWTLPLDLPGRPQLDLEGASETATDQVKHLSAPTLNFGLAGHFRFEEQGGILNFCVYQDE